MAILKIISHGKTNKSKIQLLKYVLNPKKTKEEFCYVTGDYQLNNITPQNVYQEFQRVRTLFEKNKIANCRTYTHGTIAFAKGEIKPEEVRDFAIEFVEKVYPNHQALIATHMDSEHGHAHFVLEPVSFVDGKMLHTSKIDLEKAKIICNEMCLERSLHVPEKGKHYDGSDYKSGEVTAWKKNKHHMLAQSSKKAYLNDLACAVKVCMKVARSEKEFSGLMQNEYGWTVVLKDSRKNVTFVDAEGHRVRDTNLKKTFNIEISKEILRDKFEYDRKIEYENRRVR